MMTLQQVCYQFNLIRIHIHSLHFPEYTFPADLTTEERAYVHASAQQMGMKSKSQG